MQHIVSILPVTDLATYDEARVYHVDIGLWRRLLTVAPLSTGL